MDELIDLVAHRAGLPREQARAAVQAMLEFMRARLPASAAGQLEVMLSGGPAATGDAAVEAVTKRVSGMIGD